MKLKYWLISLLTISAFPLCAMPLLIEGNLSNWQQVVIKGKTAYEPIMDIEQGVVVRAESLASASAYQNSHGINLLKTPILQWQWTAQLLPYYRAVNEQGIERTIKQFDERTAQHDDFVLRVTIGTRALFNEDKTLNYVWSNSLPIGTHWQQDANTHFIVVSGENQVTMQWQTLARDMRKDWSEAFKQDIKEIDFVSIMTDSDGIQGHAVGYYGDMRSLAGQPIAAQ